MTLVHKGHSTSNKIVVSNGFGRFHLSVAAKEAESRGRLSLYLTGAYPVSGIKKLIGFLGLSQNQKILRYLDREEEIPPGRVRAYFFSELIMKFALFLRQYEFHSLATLINKIAKTAFRIYGLRARQSISAILPDAGVYHYRAGFGGVSVPLASQNRLLTIYV